MKDITIQVSTGNPNSETVLMLCGLMGVPLSQIAEEVQDESTVRMISVSTPCEVPEDLFKAFDGIVEQIQPIGPETTLIQYEVFETGKYDGNGLFSPLGNVPNADLLEDGRGVVAQMREGGESWLRNLRNSGLFPEVYGQPDPLPEPQEDAEAL